MYELQEPIKALATSGDIAVELVCLDEGLCGEYNPNDPDDVALYRYDVYLRGPVVALYSLEREVNEQGWAPADSYCTEIPMNVLETTKMVVLHRIMAAVHIAVSENTSIKEIGLRALSGLTLAQDGDTL